MTTVITSINNIRGSASDTSPLGNVNIDFVTLIFVTPVEEIEAQLYSEESIIKHMGNSKMTFLYGNRELGPKDTCKSLQLTDGCEIDMLSHIHLQYSRESFANRRHYVKLTVNTLAGRTTECVHIHKSLTEQLCNSQTHLMKHHHLFGDSETYTSLCLNSRCSLDIVRRIEPTEIAPIVGKFRPCRHTIYIWRDCFENLHEMIVPAQ
jgi:hypothetical protein